MAMGLADEPPEKHGPADAGQAEASHSATDVDGSAADAANRGTPGAAAAKSGRTAPLSFAQRQLWIISQFFPDSPFCHMPIACRLIGAIDIAAHSGNSGGALLQIISQPCRVRLSVIEITGATDQDRITKARQVVRNRLAAGDHILLALVHHFVAHAAQVERRPAPAVSAPGLAPDLMAALRAFARDASVTVLAVTLRGLTVLLSSYCCTGDMAIGRALANRNEPEFELSAFRLPGQVADTGALVSALSFDASVGELWPYITAGARVRIADGATRTDPDLLAAWQRETGATIVFASTPMAELPIGSSPAASA